MPKVQSPKPTDANYVEIEKPARELATHILVKGVQAGTIVGAVGGIPAALFWHRLRSPLAVLDKVGSYSFLGATVCLVGVGFWAYSKMSGFTPDEIYDRAYRLRYSFNQNRVDKFTAYGGLIGGIAGTLTMRSAAGFFRVGALGVALGVLAHVASPVPAEQIPEGFH